MGEAKRKKQLESHLAQEIPLDVIERVSNALKKVATAASSQYGVDCHWHAIMGHRLLEQAGYKTTVRCGFAAWRVGPGDGDMIVHAPVPGVPVSDRSFPYHMWLEFNNQILDFTTYQLVTKAQQLDAQDQGNTRVDWAPEYLLANKSTSVSLNSATQGDTGLYFYHADHQVEMHVRKNERPIDEEDFIYLSYVFENPKVGVFGPRNT